MKTGGKKGSDRGWRSLAPAGRPGGGPPQTGGVTQCLGGVWAGFWNEAMSQGGNPGEKALPSILLT